MHEGGHGLYEQGVDERLAGTILSGGTSLGIHESQSRFWENCIGRSLPFWQFWFPVLKNNFPERLGEVQLVDFWKAVNKVEPGFIRVDADEVTYNLHIILRFELEKELIEGNLNVQDLPMAWNHKMMEYLGITPPNDRLGVLQDVHWSMMLFGYFPTYTLGNLYAAQVDRTIKQKLPGFKGTPMDIRMISEWLRHNLCRFGSAYDPGKLIARVTGEPLNPAYFKEYLHSRFSEIYEL